MNQPNLSKERKSMRQETIEMEAQFDKDLRKVMGLESDPDIDTISNE